MSDDQNDSFGQIVQHRVRGVVNQIAAVEEGNHLHAGRRMLLIQLLHLLVDALQRRVRLGALAQQHDAFDHVVVVEDLAIGNGGSPCRSARAGSWGPAHLAMSLMRNGVPFCVLITVLSISCTLLTQTDLAHVDLLQPCSMKLPPALTLLLASCCSTCPMLSP